MLRARARRMDMKRWLSALTALIMSCTLALGGPAWSLEIGTAA
jgi:hypothetical protein